MIYSFNNIVYTFNINNLIILEYSKKSDKRIIGFIKSSIKDKLIDSYSGNRVRFLSSRDIINIKIENLFLVREIRINS